MEPKDQLVPKNQVESICKKAIQKAIVELFKDPAPPSVVLEFVLDYSAGPEPTAQELVEPREKLRRHYVSSHSLHMESVERFRWEKSCYAFSVACWSPAKLGEKETLLRQSPEVPVGCEVHPDTTMYVGFDLLYDKDQFASWAGDVLQEDESIRRRVKGAYCRYKGNPMRVECSPSRGLSQGPDAQ